MTLGVAIGALVGAFLILSSGVTAAQGPPACTAAPIGSAVVKVLNRIPLVTATANGKPVTFLLDTGAQQTVLIQSAAERIGGETPKVEFSRQMRGIANSVQTREVELRSFSINGVALPWRRVRVIPPIPSLPVDGLFGRDSLDQFDIDFDMPQGRIVLYRQRSCDIPLPNWPTPYATLEAVGKPGSLLHFPVHLDGREITAAIDTGTQHTSLTATAAAKLGVTDGVLARDRAIGVRGAAAEEISSRIHRFAQLKIADLLITNPEIVVSNVNFRGVDMLLGMDILSNRRFWISHTARRIFIAK